jgi:membrane fusion protein
MQNDSTLYRQAAWQAYAMQRHGSPLLLPNTRAWVISTGLCAWFALMLLALNTHSFTEKSTVAGFISSKEPSIAIVAKEGSGLITDVYVENGQHVKKGERLLTIMRTNQIIADKNNVSAQLNALNEHIHLLEQVKKNRLQDSLQQLEYLAQQKHATLQQKDALLLQAGYLNQRIEIAQKQVSKFAALAKQQLISADALDNVIQTLLSMRQQSAQLSQQLSDNPFSAN